ncbi:IS1182 family transposase, partial [Paenibacillus sp. 23TSA30-6]|uniref:IS1182 family transposase n=1 Tax=Paenibacillus sp. 23TSA30-6 TaxID=2546104 RepID=UPI00178821BA
MLRSHRDKQQSFEFVSLEELVPQDHLLRKVDKYIDFSFIHEKVSPLYCANNGRPAIDPTVLFKMIFLGYFYGIRSERQLEREIQTNLAYRWFLGLGLTDKVPDHTTISWNRRTRFKDTTIFQDIFDEIVLQAISHRMVGGRVLVTDSTHVKANANKHQYTKEQVLQNTKDYMDELNAAVTEDRRNHGKKALKSREEVNEEKEVKVSKTDPDSGYMIRDGKPEGFFYLDHRTVDTKYNVITDVHVTPGNVHDSVPYLSRLDRQRERFGFQVEAVALDSGYLTTPICR